MRMHRHSRESGNPVNLNSSVRLRRTAFAGVTVFLSFARTSYNIANWEGLILKTVREIRKILESHKGELRGRYGVKEMGIFGSYVKKEQTEISDIDILVEFEKPTGLLEFVGLKNYLSDLFGMNVDLVMRKALKPRIGQRILSEVVYV